MKIKASKLLLTAVLIFVLSIAMFVSVSFAANETHTTQCERFVKTYSYSDAIAYINDGKADTYPTKEGYIFAGWYTDETCTEGYWGQEKPGENVYALFVPSHVLSVKAQVSANLVNANTDDDASASIRFVTTVDTLLYTQTGFEISYTVDGTAKNAVKSSTVVYQRLYAVKEGDSSSSDVYEENGKVYTPQDSFCNLSTYFKACTVKNIPSENFTTKFTVKPFWYTLDGSKVYGETAVKAIADYFAKSDVYVETTGADTVKNGSQEKPFKTLEYALGMVADGGTIHIVDSYTAPSTFTWEEHGKSVTITGGPIDFTALTVVTNDSPAVEASMLHIGDSVTFKDIELKFASGAHAFAQGHTLEMAEGVTFSNHITLCGGAYLKEVAGNTNLILKSGEYTTIYGGGFGGKVTGDTNITLSGVVNESADYTSHESNATKGARKLFGGGYGAAVNGDTNIKVQSSTVEFNYIFGGGHYNAVNGDTHIEYEGSAMALYGGGLSGTVTGNTHITMTGGWAHQIFGGCHGKSMVGSANIDVQGGIVQRRVYGGCYNDDGTEGYHVNGYTTVSIGKSANVQMNYGVDDSLIAISRTSVVSEEEKGVFVFNDYQNNSYVNKIGLDSIRGIAACDYFYSYLVKAEAGGSVSADGNYLIITPNEGKTAKVMINSKLMHYAEGETAYKIPSLSSSTEQKEIIITFGDVDASIDKSVYEASIDGAYYNSLEEAVEAAKVLSTEELAVTVALLKDAEVETTMSITDLSNVTVQSEGTNKYTINRATTLISADGEIFNVSEGNTLTVKNVVLDGRTATALEVGSENTDHSATLIYNAGTTNVENVTAQYSTGAAIQTKGSDAVLSLDTVTVTNPGESGLTLSSGTIDATDVTVQNTTDVAIGVGANATFYMNNVNLINIGSGIGHHGICNYGGTIYAADNAEQALTVQTVQGHALANLDNGTVIMNGVTIRDVEGQSRDAIYSTGGIIVVADATITNTAHDGIYLTAGTTTVVDTTIENVARSGITATDSTSGTSEVITKNVTVKVSDDAEEGTRSSQYGIYCVRGTVYADNIRVEEVGTTTDHHAVLNNGGTIQTAEHATQTITVIGATGNGLANINDGITSLTGVTIQDVAGKGISSNDGTVTVENVTVDNAADGIYMNHAEITGEFTVKHATITGVTRGIAIAKGIVDAEDVIVEKSTKTGAKEHTYGVFVSSANSTAKLEDVTVDEATTAGIGTTGGTVHANNVTVTGGAAGIETKAGTMLKATDATTGITINGTAYGIKNMSGTTTLKNVAVNNTTTAGVYMEAGTLNTEDVTVSGGPVGIETKAGTVTGVSIENITQAGIKKDSGSSTVENVTIANAKQSGIIGVQMTGGTLFLDTIHVTGGNKGVHITGGTLGATDTPIKGVTITGTNDHAVHIQNATVYADDLDVSHVHTNTKKGIVVQGGTAVVTNSKINNINNSAVYIAKSSATAANVTLEGVNITQCGTYGIQMDGADNITTTLNAVTIDQAASGIAFAGGTLTIDDLAITGTAKCIDVNGAATLTGKVNFVPTSYAENIAIVAKKDSVSADVLASVSEIVEIAPDANGGAWFVNSEGILTKAVAVIDDAYYTDFASALTAAENMDEVTITLADNVSLSEAIVVNNNLTLKSTKTITIQWETDTTSDMIKVSSGKEFKILGEEDKKITVERTQTSNSSSHVIYNSGITELSHVIIKGGRIGVQSAGTNIIINNTTIQDTGNKGLTIADGNATISNSTIKNTPDNGIFLYKDGKGSGIKNVELNNVTVNDVNGTDKHGINIAEGNVTVKNELRIERVSGHGVAVTGGTLNTDSTANGTIEVKDAARCGIYATVAIDVQVTSISGCANEIWAKNTTITINGISKTAPNVDTYYLVSDFTSN